MKKLLQKTDYDGWYYTNLLFKGPCDNAFSAQKHVIRGKRSYLVLFVEINLKIGEIGEQFENRHRLFEYYTYIKPYNRFFDKIRVSCNSCNRKCFSDR